MKRLTLVEVGKLAGVSRSTVSRVINKDPNVSPKARARVEQVIEETGYQPNNAARTLASQQSKTLGLIMPSILQSAFTDPYYPRLIQGISHSCNQNDYTVSLFLFQTKEEEKRISKRIISNGLVDGLIITADTVDNPFTDQIQDANLPYVQIGRPYNKSSDTINYIDVDNEAGANIATTHLIQQGFQRIAQIATMHNSAGVDRDAGYRRALSERGFPVREELIEVAEFSEESGYQAMKKLIQVNPDAVFVQSDAMAIGALRAIRDEGLTVPNDIAVVSFDDLPLAAKADPPLTTVRQPIFRTGVLAVETLIDIIQTTSTTARHIVLPVELVIRSSCGTV